MALTIDPTSLGARTSPSSALPALSLASVGSDILPDALPLSHERLSHGSQNGAIYATGYSRMRHIVEGTAYPTGLLAPKGFSDTATAPGVTAQGRASFVDLELNGAIFSYTTAYVVLQRRWNGGAALGAGAQEYGCWFEFQVVSTLAAANAYWQIVRQPDPADTLAIMVAALDADSSTWVEGTHWRAPDVTHASYSGPSYDPTALPAATAHPYLMGEVINSDTIRFTWRFPGPISDYTRLRQSGLGDEYPDPDESTWKQVVQGVFPTASPDGTGAYLYFYGDENATPTLNALFGVYDSTDAGTQTAHWWVTFKSAVVGGALQLEALCDNVGRGDTSFDALCHAEDYFRGVSATWRGGTAFYAAPAAPGPSYNYWGFTDWELVVTGATAAGGHVEGYIRWNKPTVRTNATYFKQTCWNGSRPPVPAYNTWVQLEGGTDPVPLTVVTLQMPGKGEYRVSPSWFREADNARSGKGDYLELDHTGGGYIEVSGFPTADDPDVDYLRLWRTLLDRPGDFFRVDDVIVAESEYLDEKGDGEIAGVFGSLMYNPREYRHREAGYPPSYRHLEQHLGSVWGAGISRAADQTGTADFTNGSDEVVIDAPLVPTGLWVGRHLQRDGVAETYRIAKVDVATLTVTLSKDYEGDTETAGAITVRDDRLATQVGRAEPGFHNQWPSVREWWGIDTRDALGVTALASSDQRLFMWTRDGIWVLHGNSPTTYNLDPVDDGIGCAVHRALVVHRGAAYWLEGPEGIYAWGFEGVPQRISNPPYTGEGEVQGIQGTIDRINWDAIDWAHAIASPDGRRILWFLPVDGSEWPNLTVTLDLKSGTWSTETCDGVTSSCVVTKPDGTLAVVVGDVYGQVWELDQGDSDGVYGLEPKHAVDTGATVASIPVKDSTMAASLEGLPFLVVYADGSTERGIIAASTTSSITPYDDLAVAPAEDDVILLGAIDVEVEPNRFHQGVPEEEKVVPTLWVHSRKGTGEYYLDVAVDEDDLASPTFDSPVGDLTRDDGIERFRVNLIGHRHAFRIRAWVPGTDMALRMFKLQTQVFGTNQVAT